MTEIASHYQELLNQTRAMDELHGDGLAVAVIPPLMRRADGNNVFEEGAVFSGAQQQEGAEAYITVTASPHIRPNLSKARLIEAAEATLGKRVLLPEGMQNIAYVSPQVMIWWHDTTGEKEDFADFIAISSLPPERQKAFCNVIAQQTAKATEIITNTTSKPTIWGSWGFATPEERLITGKGRGVPTNRHGHLHVIDFTAESPENGIDNTISAAEKLNHYGPWGSILHQTFAEPLSRAIQLTIDASLSAKVTPSATALRTPGNQTVRTMNNGYTITFDTPQPDVDVFGTLVRIAGTFETFYKNVAKSHADYYTYQSDPHTLASVQTQIAEAATGLGFSHEEAEHFVRFALGVRPTYGQVCTWLKELAHEPTDRAEDMARLHTKKQLYERVSQRLGRQAANNSLSAALIRDTVANPQDYASIGRVWPEHSSTTFIIDDYKVSERNVLVKSIKLIPSIDSTKSAPEHVTDRVLRRSTGST